VVTSRLYLKRHAPLLGSLQLVHATSQVFNAIIRPCATMLSSATKKEPSPLTIARPLVAEAGATKSINEVKESRLVASTKVTLRANAVM